jgi:hypothetical protein
MSDGRRHAALMLHSLAEDDRRWVLQQLPGGDRVPLETLLGELLELGIRPILPSSRRCRWMPPDGYAPPARGPSGRSCSASRMRSSAHASRWTHGLA